MAFGPTTEEGVSRPPVLPVFKETNLPSAKQDGLMILVDDGAGNLKIGASRDGKWFLFVHDSTVT